MKKWYELTSQEQHNTRIAMMNYGGSFVERLAEAWERADSENSSRLGAAFPDLVQRYGPGTHFYKEAR